MGLVDKCNTLQSQTVRTHSLRAKAISLVQNEIESAAKPPPHKSKLSVVSSAPLALSLAQPESAPPPKAAPAAKPRAAERAALQTADARTDISAPPPKAVPAAKSRAAENTAPQTTDARTDIPAPPPSKAAPAAKSRAAERAAPQTTDARTGIPAPPSKAAPAAKPRAVERAAPPSSKAAPAAKSRAPENAAPQTTDARTDIPAPPPKAAPAAKPRAAERAALQTADARTDISAPPPEPGSTGSAVSAHEALFFGKDRRKINVEISDYIDRREHRARPGMFDEITADRRHTYERRSVRRAVEDTDTLSIINLHKNFGRKEVVHGVGFSIKGGNIAGLLGPNGAGKTTIFYMIVGFYKPSIGDIKLNNTSIVHGPMYRRARMGIAYLPQEASIFRKLTVEENIWAILESRHDITKNQKKEKLDQLINDFSIGRIRKQYGYTLSGGERRRTEIARALAIEPKFLLLDEPFAGIDPIAVYEIKQIIKRLAGEEIGILITDHNVRDTLEITTDAFIINQGVIVARGAKEHILSNQTVRDVYLGSEFRM